MKPRHPEKINKPSNPIPKKPNWIRVKLTNSTVYNDTKKIVKKIICILFARKLMSKYF